MVSSSFLYREQQKKTSATACLFCCVSQVKSQFLPYFRGFLSIFTAVNSSLDTPTKAFKGFSSTLHKYSDIALYLHIQSHVDRAYGLIGLYPLFLKSLQPFILKAFRICEFLVLKPRPILQNIFIQKTQRLTVSLLCYFSIKPFIDQTVILFKISLT